MIVFQSADFPSENRQACGSAAASEIPVHIQDDNHDKENIEDQVNIEKISSEESVNSQQVEETPQENKRNTKCS